jgi:hypothetical protein
MLEVLAQLLEVSRLNANFTFPSTTKDVGRALLLEIVQLKVHPAFVAISMIDVI